MTSVRFLHCRALLPDGTVCGSEAHTKRSHGRRQGWRKVQQKKWARESLARRKKRRREAGVCWRCGEDKGKFARCKPCRLSQASTKNKGKETPCST
jgi:hypothetical protein